MIGNEVRIMNCLSSKNCRTLGLRSSAWESRLILCSSVNSLRQHAPTYRRLIYKLVESQNVFCESFSHGQLADSSFLVQVRSEFGSTGRWVRSLPENRERLPNWKLHCCTTCFLPKSTLHSVIHSLLDMAVSYDGLRSVSDSPNW